ncbi:hypothetical protein FRB94_013499 [Tulasnella sp. JGI-2019a]|nr:hypothetical protein FRB93_010961 [Tulasnella sp. JGI-2019a]KAG8990280.1 hypothetical protein FRB94_013499 [Tulasnella sp. JGI-2019a]
MHGVWKINLGRGRERIIQELASAKVVDDEFRWLWPRLCELSVNGGSGENILGMLEARAEAATAERMSDGQLRRPVPLKRLVLRPFCEISPTIFGGFPVKW